MTTFVEKPESNAFEQALVLYKKETFPQIKLLTDIMEYAKSHYAYCSPRCIILAKVIEDRGWFIYIAAGSDCLMRFFELAPFSMPYVGFARPEKGRDAVKWYRWEQFYDRCSKKH